MTRNILRSAALTLPIFACALMPSAARAQGYTGSWPFVVSQQESVIGPFAGSTLYCITLTEATSCAGRTHCGSATILPTKRLGLYEKAYGSFQTIGQLIIVTIQDPGDSNGESDGWLFVAETSSTSSIGTGFFEVVAGGEDFDSGVLTVGAKHGCAPGS
jgi:hypothetical protein